MRSCQFSIKVYSLTLFLTLDSSLHTHLVFLICCPLSVLGYRLPTTDVPLPRFLNCPRPTVTAIHSVLSILNCLLLSPGPLLSCPEFCPITDFWSLTTVWGKKAWAIHGCWMACSVKGSPKKARQVKSELLTFQVPNLVTIFRHLGHLTEEFIQVQGSCKRFVTILFFYSEGLLAPRPTPKLENHALSLVRCCLMYPQLPSIAVPPSATRGHAMLWWQGTHLTSIILWTVVLSHHISRYIHLHISTSTLKIVAIGRMQVSVGVAAGNSVERYLHTGPIRLLLWQWLSPRPNEIDAHIAFLSSGERKRNRMVGCWVNMEGVAKRWRVVLPAPRDKHRAMCRGVVMQ
jgi:hypothetical protein